MLKYLKNCLVVMLGGAVGSSARLFITQSLWSSHPPFFPRTILFINWTGCLLTAILLALLEKRVSKRVKLFIFIGIMGSYTTFSDFSLDTNNFIVSGKIGMALLNIVLSFFGGLVLFAIGYFGTQRLKQKLKRQKK